MNEETIMNEKRCTPNECRGTGDCTQCCADCDSLCSDGYNDGPCDRHKKKNQWVTFSIGYSNLSSEQEEIVKHQMVQLANKLKSVGIEYELGGGSNIVTTDRGEI